MTQKDPTKDQPSDGILSDRERIGFRQIRSLMGEIEELKKKLLTSHPTTSEDYDLLGEKEKELFELNNSYKEEFGDDLLSNCEFSIFDPNASQLIEKNKRSKTINQIINCSHGTKWEDVKITLADDETVRIKAPLVDRLFTYHELDMNDKRSGNKPTMLWELLKQFAKNHGFITSQSAEYNPTLPNVAKRLNEHLQALFEINDSIYEGHYKKMKGYKTKIFFSDQTIAP